jgi:uncharacterized membrane protein YeaQ/YmgE (transglycosylase-associated protein family)
VIDGWAGHRGNLPERRSASHSRIFGSSERQVLIFNVGVAVVGAALGGWILGPLLGVGPGFTGFGVIVSAIGAALALLVAYFVQRRRAG